MSSTSTISTSQAITLPSSHKRKSIDNSTSTISSPISLPSTELGSLDQSIKKLKIDAPPFSPSSSSSSSTSTSSTLPSIEKIDTTKPLSKEEEIRKCFETATPTTALSLIRSKNYKLNECRCIPQFRRTLDTETIDARKIAEDQLTTLITEKFPRKNQLLTLCSVASGEAYQELVILKKLYDLGYTNIKFILVDQIYSPYASGSGPKIGKQFQELANYICPKAKVKVETHEELEDITSQEIEADVFLDFDDGRFGQATDKEYQDLLAPFEKHIHGLSKPTIYLHSEKRNAGFVYEKSKGLQEKVQAHVTLSYIAPDKEPEKRVIVDNTSAMPVHNHDVAIESRQDVDWSAYQDTYKEILDSNDFNAVCICLKKGASANLKEESGATILMRAARKGNLNTVKALVKNGGAKVELTCPLKRTVLHAATGSTSCATMIDYLVQEGRAPIDAQDTRGDTALHEAARMGNVEAVRTLIKNGASLDIPNISGLTPLASFMAHIEIHGSSFESEAVRQIRELLTPKA